MYEKLKSIVKKALVIVLCIVSITISIISSIPVALASGSYDILGTNAALGSPILNNNFTIDNWNKWEMICWGVYLSNFCQPLIDSYETAFKVGGEGSQGAGFQALCFGSGNDSANNENIEALCDYAIQQSQATRRKLWVGFTPVNDGTIGEKPDPNTADASSPVVREAVFRDFFLQNSDKGTAGGSSWVNVEGLASWRVYNFDNYNDIVTINKGSLPTFYIESNGKFIEVLDYTNSWDIQMVQLMINSIRQSYEDQFMTAYESFWGNSAEESKPIYIDAFANIMVEGKMLFPSACNQHITKTKTVNILNSWVMNGYTRTYSSDKLVTGLKQEVRSSVFNLENGVDMKGGWPAFSHSSLSNGIALLYYDLDTVLSHDYLDSGDHSLHLGKEIKKLFELDITRSSNAYPLKIEMSGTKLDAFWSSKFGSDSTKAFNITAFAASMIPNMCNKETTNPKILNELVLQDGTRQSLISDKPVIVANQLQIGDKEPSEQNVNRRFYNYIYQAYTGRITETTSGNIDKSTVSQILDKAKSPNDLNSEIKGNLWEAFSASNPDTVGKYKSQLFNVFGASQSYNKQATRLVLVYPVSDAMRAVSEVLGVVDGTTFNVYSTIIYMTYLDWYGVSNQTTLTAGQNRISDFNPDLFDETSDVLNVDPGTLIDLKSEDELENEVLQMSYLMLHPEDGRSYRKQLITTGLSDWMYEQYNRIVYGGADSVYNGSASKSNSGFLAIETYSDNWLTSWFLEGYTDIAVWIIMICCIALVILGLLKSKKVTWYIFGLFTIVNIVLIVPASGEIVPYISSNMIQKMFSSKMTYWAVSEGVANATVENDAATQTGNLSGLSSEEAKTVVSLVKQLNMVYTDRSLMLKQDISQKITQKTNGVYTDIQNLQSARWLLPMVMQQFTGDNKTEDYIYVKLSNVWDDLSNMYWYFNPSDAEAVTKFTSTSNQNGEATRASGIYNYDNKSGFFMDANKSKDDISNTDTDVNYRCYSYTLNGNPGDQVHLYSYLLPDNTRTVIKRTDVFGSDGSGFSNVDSWQKYIDYAKQVYSGKVYSWRTDRDGGFEDTADSYNRTQRSTFKDDFTYLLTTESPMYYFFNVAKDSFESTKTVGYMIGRLQGKIKTDENGNEVRDNFMYATIGNENSDIDTDAITSTGWTRDILDLQEMFTNVVPYMYQMQLITGGFDGKSGILVESIEKKNSRGEIVTETQPLKITNELQYYEGENQSWMYRCNWATKLMENPDYCKEYKVRDSNGNTYKVKNPLFYECYPAERPMIFSEAQMHAMGLTEGDLNLIELKCIEVNKQIAKQWTLLINYAGTAGLTKEVLFREMATSATEIFCEEFSSTGVLNNKYNLYPQSLDLRYLSFDSVMKMLMLNVSKDTSYIYGDTMATVIQDTDTVTAMLLLLSAFLCAYLVPLARTVLMAMIFYLGFVAIIRALFSSAKYKGQVACGQLVSNMLFIGYTLIYYAVFSGLMAITASDTVLTTDSVQVSAGNPVWVIIATIIASIVYIYTMWRQICFCFAHFRDMGFEMYRTMASIVTGKISDAIGNVKDGVSSFFSADDNSNVYNTTNTNSLSGAGIHNNSTQDVNIRQANGSTIEVTETNSEDDLTYSDEMYGNVYMDSSIDEYNEDDSLVDIDAEIEAGSQMNN